MAPFGSILVALGSSTLGISPLAQPIEHLGSKKKKEKKKKKKKKKKKQKQKQKNKQNLQKSYQNILKIIFVRVLAKLLSPKC